jgi:hypothetical protein
MRSLKNTILVRYSETNLKHVVDLLELVCMSVVICLVVRAAAKLRVVGPIMVIVLGSDTGSIVEGK